MRNQKMKKVISKEIEEVKKAQAQLMEKAKEAGCIGWYLRMTNPEILPK